MRLFLTEKMFGKCLEQIGDEFNTLEEGMKILYDWKQNEMINKLYKIERYDRMIYNKEHNETAIDFGDYYYFMLITGCGKDDVKGELEQERVISDWLEDEVKEHDVLIKKIYDLTEKDEIKKLIDEFNNERIN